MAFKRGAPFAVEIFQELTAGTLLRLKGVVSISPADGKRAALVFGSTSSIANIR